MANQVKTLADAIRYFSDEQVCIDTVAGMRWLDDNGPSCPKCNAAKDRQHWLKNQRRWQCRDCGKQHSVKVGTIFEDSAIPLQKWLPAMWLLANCKNGISSYELAKDIGVTQKSAWFMLHRLREALRDERKHKFGFGGPVESDEAFIGPNPAKMNRTQKRKYAIKRGRIDNAAGMVAKTAVHGILDRELRQVRAAVIPDVKRHTLQKAILDNVTPFAKVYTDEFTSYQGLSRNYIHKVVDHSREYVRGQIHTNGIENFWALLKRTLRGTYVAVEPFHLDQYLSEQIFRYNNRATKDNPLTDADRFALAVSQVSGKRLTYAELTGKVGETAF
jgi:transposase-like protein